MATFFDLPKSLALATLLAAAHILLPGALLRVLLTWRPKLLAAVACYKVLPVLAFNFHVVDVLAWPHFDGGDG